MSNADEFVRYCPECGTIGPIRPPAETCCPDSFGMQVRRWQAEKMDRMLNRLRGALVADRDRFSEFCRREGIEPAEAMRVGWARAWHAGFAAGEQVERERIAIESDLAG